MMVSSVFVCNSLLIRMKDNFLMFHLDNIVFLVAALIKDAKSADEKGKREPYGILLGGGGATAAF